jgi:hypothetical protein
MKYISLILVTVLIQSCALAPFSPTSSGTTNGAGTSKASFGSANTNFYLKMDYGLSENFDIGYAMEFGSISTSGLYGVYSVLNQKTGLALAFEGGYGSSGDSSYAYLGMINSLGVSDNLEFFLNIRAVNVETSEDEVTLGDTIGAAKVTGYNPRYFYNTLGINIMTGESIGLSIYSIYIVGHDLYSPNGTGSGVGLIYKL